MLGWVDDDDGTVTLQDRYIGDSEGRPSLDDEDHLTLIEGEQVDGITRIRYFESTDPIGRITLNPQ